MIPMEPWNEFETVSKWHNMFFHGNVNQADKLFFQELHSEPNPEVRQTGGGVKRVETVSNAVKHYYLGDNKTLTRSILLLTAV